MKKNKSKKPSFFRIMMDALRKAKQAYDAQVAEQINKHKLLSSHSDWSLIEKYVQMCNDNPDLKVTIRTFDGTTIIMTAYRPETPSINSRLNDITIE